MSKLLEYILEDLKSDLIVDELIKYSDIFPFLRKKLVAEYGQCDWQYILKNTIAPLIRELQVVNSTTRKFLLNIDNDLSKLDYYLRYDNELQRSIAIALHSVLRKSNSTLQLLVPYGDQNDANLTALTPVIKAIRVYPNITKYSNELVRLARHDYPQQIKTSDYFQSV